MSLNLSDLFKVKSVESITAKLSSTVSALETHAEEQLAKASVKRAEAAAAAVAEKAHRAEHETAKKVAANIKNLLG